VQAHAWYQFLDSAVMPKEPASSTAIVSKMVLDQAIWAPLNTALFYAYVAAVDGTLASLPAVLAVKLVPTVLAGYALWPMAHLINFKFIPSNQRLLYINIVNLFWTVYLSRMANSSSVIDLDASEQVRFGLAIPVTNSAPAQPKVFHV
jgi:protein Mpv17